MSDAQAGRAGEHDRRQLERRVRDDERDRRSATSPRSVRYPAIAPRTRRCRRGRTGCRCRRTGRARSTGRRRRRCCGCRSRTSSSRSSASRERPIASAAAEYICSNRATLSAIDDRRGSSPAGSSTSSPTTIVGSTNRPRRRGDIGAHARARRGESRAPRAARSAREAELALLIDRLMRVGRHPFEPIDEIRG